MIKKLVQGLVGLAALAVIATAIPLGSTAIEQQHETTFTTMDTQDGVTWGLDRIDGTVDSSYTYLSSGAGVRIYIVDTGVDAAHPDFGSRVSDGFDAFGQNLDQTDCQGHGTHVAGIAAGNYFGVAKSATIVPVRVLNCSGQGNTTTLTAGIDWILATHPGGTPAIVNMSLGGPKDDAVNAATSRLVSAGMSVVVAAGNSNVDACSFSPASAQGVIAVGSIAIGDTKSGFSNWGTCVDTFAPGSRINSNSPFNHSTAVQKSGTSQAASFVSGIIATYLSSGIAASPSSAETKLYELADQNTVLGGASPGSSIANVQKSVPLEPSPEQVPEVVPVPSPELVTTPEPEAVVVVAPEPVTAPEPAADAVNPAPEPEPEPGTIANPNGNEDAVDYNLRAYQSSPGARTGWLKWDLIDGAQYQIYKTGSIRPELRLFATINNGINRLLLSDAYESIAIYSIVAVLGSETIDMGEVKYYPIR